MKITIVGGGYVGLVTGACFAESGHDVTIIEVDPAKVGMINEKKAPVFDRFVPCVRGLPGGPQRPS